MTQDNDDLLTQVFSVLPTLEGQTDVNSNAKVEQEIVANVRRVSNAFQDFIDKSGVVEPNVVSYEHHTESHQHVTSHVETHNESVTIGGGHHETIGRGAAIAEHHEESHIVGNGASVISTELNPPAHEDHHFTISAGVVPQADDNESVVSVRTGLSEATSVSVHSSVSQKSIQIYADAPVIVKDTSRGSLASHKSSVVPESHHSETAHTHERERTISSASTISETSTLTGSAASGNTAIENYVFVENTGSHHEHHHHEHHHLEHDHHHEVHHQHNGSQDTATPIAVMKSDPHDALIEEFKARHQRVPSEVSSFVVAPVSQQPPPPTVPPPVESDDESEVVMTVKVTQYEFDSHDVKHAIEHHHEHHTHHEHHEHEVHHDEPVQHGYIHKDEPEHHFEDHTRHNGFDSHAVVGYGTVPRHTEEDDFHFETVEYHEQIHHEPAPASIYNDNVSVAPSEPRSEVPPVFFQSPVLARKAPQQTVNNFDSGSEVSGHHGHHQYHHEDVHNHHPIHRELIPNITGPFVRDELRPAHVSEEHRVVTVPKTISAPVAHVQPVVSHSVVHHHHRQEPRGLPRIDHREALIPHVEEAPVVHKVAHHVEHHHHHKEVQHHHHDHHEHHHVHNERHLPRSERHYHKHDDQMTEIFSGPSVRDLKSQFELGGEVKVHYGTHYISHKDQTSAPIHVESNHHHHHDDEHPHYHHEHVEEHHEPPPVVDSVGQPRLPHRELKEEHIHTHHHPEYIHTHVKEHAHHHHEHKEDQHHHHHHKETVHHHENEELDHHEDLDHHEHHHEPHLDTHQYVAEEEDQLPVSALLGRFGGGAKLRRPDHAEVISRASSVPNVTVVEEVHHHHHDDVQPKSRTVTQSSVSTARSHSTYSVQTSQTRSHASTLTQDHHHNVAAAAPVAAARSPVADHSSLRVVKSVRAFVSEWGQKDFQPPMSPIITVPRLPSSPKSPVAQPIPEPATRKSTVLSEVSNATHSTHQSHTPEHHAIQHIERALHDDAGSVCSRCTKSNRGKSVSSVGSTATTYTTTSHHQEPVVVHIGEGAHQQIPEVHEEFVLTPLAERRALFEQGLNRGYSINRKTHGELRPMVNVFTD